MPEVRLIDGDALEKGIDDAMKKAHDQFNFVAAQLLAIVKQAVQEQPTIEAEPVRHGHWIPVDGEPYAKCSYCGEKHYGCTTPYCDMCGAYMRKEGADNG